MAGTGIAFYPLSVGASWTWRITEPGIAAPTTRTEEVVRTCCRDGVTAYELRRTEDGMRTFRFLDASVERVVEYRSRRGPEIRGGMDPQEAPRVLLDCPPTVGKNWEWSGRFVIGLAGAAPSSTVASRWHHRTEIMALDESVTVPAGTFRALRVQRTSRHETLGAVVCTTWFAPGIGIVKEAEGARTLELLACTLPASRPRIPTRADIVAQLGLAPGCAAELVALASDDVGVRASAFYALPVDKGARLVRVFGTQAEFFDATAATDWNRLIEDEHFVPAGRGREDYEPHASELAGAVASLHQVQTQGGEAVAFFARRAKVIDQKHGFMACMVVLDACRGSTQRTIKMQFDRDYLASLEIVAR